MIFGRNSSKARRDDNLVFNYLDDGSTYFDSACQTLRPRPVIQAMADYYTKFNSCGDRVKYDWGLMVDERVAETRQLVLKLLNLSARKYFVSFTLNTTYGLNLILSQLNPDGIKKIYTTDIEHNSVFLSTLTFSERHDINRTVIERNDDGSIDIDEIDFTDSLVVVNAVSNIDSRRLTNIKQLVQTVHKQNGLVVIDAAQAMSHYSELLSSVEADVVCFSSHKMYGPSLGVIVCRKDLISRLKPFFIGGGMVNDVRQGSYKLLTDNDDELHTIFEPGLQLYAEIIGLGEAIKWLIKANKHSQLDNYANKLYDFLSDANHIQLINHQPGTALSFYHDKFDSHMLAKALSDQGIMVRSGYFCAHYYLHHVRQLPPLIRVSLGEHNTQADIDKFIEVIKGIIT